MTAKHMKTEREETYKSDIKHLSAAAAVDAAAADAQVAYNVT